MWSNSALNRETKVLTLRLTYRSLLGINFESETAYRITSGRHSGHEAYRGSALREMVSEPEPVGVILSAPGLLEWLGAGFGDAIAHTRPPPLSIGGIRLEDVIRALPAAIYTTDAVGRITFYNEAAAELWGCRPEIGKSEFCGSWKLYWPDGSPLPHGECPMAVALKEQRMVRGMEAVAKRPDGTLVHFVPYPTLLFDESGTLVGAVNMLIDTSDRKRAEADAQRLVSLVESSDNAIRPLFSSSEGCR
jgi:PAS domain S-box-containing protein